MNRFVERSVRHENLPFAQNLEHIRIEELVIGYQNAWSIDLGALCYLRRSPMKRTVGRGRPVDHTSFDAMRAESLRKFARVASDYFANSGHRISTIFSLHSSFSRFLDWCDNNGHADTLENSTYARAAFEDYTSFLSGLVDRNKLHVNTAADYQQNIIDVMESHFGFDNLTQGVRKLAKSKQLARSTPVPNEQAQTAVLAW